MTRLVHLEYLATMRVVVSVVATLMDPDAIVAVKDFTIIPLARVHMRRELC